MNDLEIPYRHHEIFTPNVAPFDSAGTLLWPTIVGTFLRPIIESAEVTYWFCDHGKDFQFCFATEQYEKIENVIEQQKELFGVKSKVIPVENTTIATAFRGLRWMSPSNIKSPADEALRSSLVLNFLHSTSALYLNSLVKENEHWKLEINNESLQNPEGSNFETLLHMLCNISQVSTMVQPFEILDPTRKVGGIETPFAISHIVDKSQFPVKVGPKIKVHY